MIFLKEMLSIWGWLALVIGFTGIIFVFQPDLDTGLAPNILGVFNGVAAGAAYTSVRRLREFYDTRSIVLSFMGWGLILPIISMLIYPYVKIPQLDFLISPFNWPTGITWFWAFMVGITAMLGQIFITKAYGNEKAGIVSTIGYINIPFAVVFGILLGDSFPDIKTILGIVFIIISGIVISIRRNI
jgi:drug/metabolite transporter (DMT)-like permease